jgi:hypothetical protein
MDEGTPLPRGKICIMIRLMRRSELESKDPADFAALMSTSVGHLGIITPDGYPRVVPVNFAAT